jgi:hypothetical protein
MFAMALNINGHDSISIYEQESNWVEQIFNDTLLKLVLIDIGKMDIIDQCCRLHKDISLDKKKNTGNSGKNTQIRLCFLARDKSSAQRTRIQRELKKEFSNEYGALLYDVDDVVERPFTITEVIDTANSQLLSVCV